MSDEVMGAEGAAVWRSAVREQAETVLATWAHTPRLYQVLASPDGSAILAECTTPGCAPEGDPHPSGIGVGHVVAASSEAEARADLAEHIARVHWPEDD